jgi:hypothetical protein
LFAVRGSRLAIRGSGSIRTTRTAISNHQSSIAIIQHSAFSLQHSLGSGVHAEMPSEFRQRIPLASFGGNRDGVDHHFP